MASQNISRFSNTLWLSLILILFSQFSTNICKADGFLEQKINFLIVIFPKLPTSIIFSAMFQINDHYYHLNTLSTFCYLKSVP